MAAFFNLTGALFGGAVASTIGKGLVDTEVVTMTTVLCAVIAAFSWNVATWWFGLPSSSSHALIGGLCGAALAAAKSDWSVIKWNEGVWPKVVLPMIASPIAGFVCYLENCKSSARLGWRTATAQTMRRKRWVSSLWRCLPVQRRAPSIIGRAGSIF